MRHFLLSLILLAVSSCSTLDKSGVYQGDQILYQAELSIKTSYDLIHVFVTWEYNNRASLRKWPEITKAADNIRAHAKDWFATANNLHDAYKVNPSSENKTALQTSISILLVSAIEANKWMLQAAQPSK